MDGTFYLNGSDHATRRRPMYVKLLEKKVKQGIINLHLPGGESYRFGSQGLETRWVINNEDVIKRIAKDWEWELGETYVNGGWDVPDGELRDLLFILRANFRPGSINKWLQPFVKFFQQWNRVSSSYRNVSRHYDLEEDFFRYFLDRDMHYSCAYFPEDNCTLEDAQQAKSRHISRKLLLKPGQRVLDIGCGWGSLAFDIARQADVEVVGITLSKEQLAVARRRAWELGLDNVSFELQDYREHGGEYDRIVSVGMFEHVGKPFYNTYFDRINDMLRQDGVALIHSIGHSGPPRVTNPWITKYIFPGGGLPALSQMTGGVEKAGLMLTDVEVLRLHYARTLSAWYKRFQLHRDQIRAQMGERFCRIWEFYLAICEVSFRCADLVVFQLQLAKQHGVVPTTRDYQYIGQQDLSVVQNVGRSPAVIANQSVSRKVLDGYVQ